jgi:hypothetical protein
VEIGYNSAFQYSGGTTIASSFSNGVYIGNSTKVGIAGATNETVIGYLAEGRGSNTTTIGNTSTTSSYLFGTLRIGTINNLGVASTEVLVPSATGVVSKRTLAEFRSDIGGIGGSGTVNTVAKFTASGTVGDSVMSDNGLQVTVQTDRFGSSMILGADNNTTLNTSNVNKSGGISFRHFGGSQEIGALSYSSTSSISELRLGLTSNADYSPTSITFRVNSSTTAGGGSSMLGLTMKTSGSDFLMQGVPVANTILEADRGNLILRSSLSGIVQIGSGATNFVGVNTNSPTNTLDINGTTRIRTIDNLGVASTEVLVPSATGVVSKRTVGEFRSDIGAQVSIAGTATEGYVATVVGGIATWAAGGGGDSVLYTAQTKTASEKLIARTNIGSTSATSQIIATAGAINDLVVTSNHLVFTGASVVLSGIVNGLDGEEITILNASGTTLSILSESVLSTISNRFNSAVLIPNLSILRIKYRTTSNRWFLENVGTSDGRYVRKDVADTKIGNLTFTNAAIINGHIDVNGSTSAAGGVALNRFRNATAGSGITQFFGTNGGSSRQHFAFYGSGDVEYISFGNGWLSSGVPTAYFRNSILLTGSVYSDASNIGFGTTTGTKIGTATTQKLAFWNKTPIIQPTTGIAGATLVGGGGTTITSTDTFGGYTVAQIAQALINMGLLT